MATERLEASFTVRVDECGTDNRVGIGAVGNYLQEIAWRHATLLGYGREALLERNVAWVMTRMRLCMARYPGPGETLRLETWPSARDRHLAYRDFRLYDAAGEILGRCTTAWANMDVAARRMAPFEEHGEPMPYTGERSLEFERRAVPKLREPEHAQRMVSRRSDLDVNGHVNNVHFVEWALESLPQEWIDGHRLREVDISFRQECHPHTPLTSLCASGGEDGEWLHLLRRDADDVELARVSTLWEPC